jgi:hypothetical protein
MFTSQKSTGGGYTTTVAYLAVALIFSPAMLVLSRPVGYVAISFAIACSALCVALAWVNWRKSSQRSLLSIEQEKAVAK